MARYVAQSLDFTKRKKQFLTLILDDEQQTKLLVRQPTKRLFELMLLLGSKMQDVAAITQNASVLDEMYELAAELISFNKQAEAISGEKLAELLDFEDLVVFFEAYSDFVQSAFSAKN